MTFFIINRNTRDVIRVSDSPFNLNKAIQPPNPNHIQLEQVDDGTLPSFNPATHKLERQFVDNDEAFTRTFQYVAVVLSAEELAENQLLSDDEAEKQILITNYDDLKNGEGTIPERLERIEAALAWSLRGIVRNGFDGPAARKSK